ncbi:MAG: transcription elongation factor GreA [Candidatus Omnitrophota bacterium]
MGTGDIYLTHEGYEKLREEFEYLTKTKRRKLSRAIAEAREKGDLRENAEYDAAKEAQAWNEKRIAELEEKIVRAKIIDEQRMDKERALLGAKIKILDVDSNEECEYTLVSEMEADFTQGKISVTSPIGKGLLGHKENEVVEVKVPVGLLKYKILKISRE